MTSKQEIDRLAEEAKRLADAFGLACNNVGQHDGTDYMTIPVRREMRKAIEALATLARTPSGQAEDAVRYRWLRDYSNPGVCAFYLSVGKAFDGVKFARATVDEAIDAQIASATRTRLQEAE